MTAAMVEGSCSWHRRSRSSASSPPCLRLAAREGVLRRIVRVAHVVHARHQRAENLAVADDAADRGAAEIDAVVALLAADQADALALAALAVVGDRELERGIHRLGARVGEEDARHALGQQRRELLGELEGRRMAHLERRREVQRRHRLLHRLDDGLAAMAGVDAPQARGAVEDLAALGGVVIHPLGAREQPRRLLEGRFIENGMKNGEFSSVACRRLRDGLFRSWQAPGGGYRR